uniref:YceI domain-containing protein n=1 Tax=Panagrellus redivivus TaxID=6233 RepID=A0A7E5A1S0_PANRE
MDFEFEDSETIVVKTDLLDAYGQFIKTARRPTSYENLFWWLECYPNGDTDDSNGHVSIFLHTSVGGFGVEATFTVDRSGIRKRKSIGCTTPIQVGFPKFARHSSIRSGSIIYNDTFVIRCKVSFKTYSEPASISLIKTCVKDSVTFTISEKQLEMGNLGNVKSLAKKFATDSDKHQWQLAYFSTPATSDSEGTLNMFVEASTTETNTVTLSGVIKVDGTSFEKKFNMLVDDRSISVFPKLITHEQLRCIGGIIDSKVTVTCDVSFETQY